MCYNALDRVAITGLRYKGELPSEKKGYLHHDSHLFFPKKKKKKCEEYLHTCTSVVSKNS